MDVTRRSRGLIWMGAIFSLGLSVFVPVTGAQTHRATAPAARKSASQAAASATERPDIARFRARVATALAAPGADHGLWGMLIADADTGAVLYAQNADSYFTPASTAKLFTTALALATLGPDYRIRTTIEAVAAPDSSGELHGDLTLVGRGDANLSNRRLPFDKRAEREGLPEKALAELADAVVARGVKKIDGDVIADDSFFRSERFPSGWSVDDIMWSYGAAVSAISVNDNTFALNLRAGDSEGAPVTATVEPPVDYYVIENSIRTGSRGAEEKLMAAREPGSHRIRVTGIMPAGAPIRRLEVAVEEPAEYAAALLARLLKDRGVQISGEPRGRHAPDVDAPSVPQNSSIVLAERSSVPLAQDIRLTNKISLNLHAELLLLLAAHEKAGAISRDDATSFASDFYKSAGVTDKSVILEDGSGLSRHDLVTPRAFVQLLTYAATQPWGEVYRSTLPIAGEDGTLTDRMKNTPAAGHVFAKTGTIGHVNTLSGYATTVHGAHLIFSVLGNNNNMHAHDADVVLDSIVVAMVEELGSAPAVHRASPAPPRKAPAAPHKK